MISEVALKRLGLDKVWWIVSPGNPLKKRNDTAPLSERLVLCREVAKNPHIVITDFEADPTGSAQGRWSDYRVATRFVVANPVLGAGIGQDILALDRLRARVTWRSIHNAYLEYAVDLGLPGLLLFLWLLVATFRSARRVENRTSTEPSLRDLCLLASSVQIALAAFAAQERMKLPGSAYRPCYRLVA
jgi:hypothetical protein